MIGIWIREREGMEKQWAQKEGEEWRNDKCVAATVIFICEQYKGAGLIGI